MNYLQLCQRTRQECGISGSGPVSVENQIGEMQRVVDWVSEAYTEIQSSKQDWRFLWMREGKGLMQGSQYHSLTSLSMPAEKIDDARFRVYKASIGTKDIQGLTYIPWEDYCLTYDRGISTGNQSRPTFFSIRPDKRIAFPEPLDADYTMLVEYYRDPYTLAANTDIPVIPSKYHMAIVWQAVIYYSIYEEASILKQNAEQQLSKIMSKMYVTELPPVRFGDPLA